MTTKHSLKDHPQPILQHRIEWLTRELEHIKAELMAARAELKRRKK